MSKFANHNFIQSLKCAIHGIRLVIKSEKNILRHLVLGLLTVIISFILKFNNLEFCIVILCIAIILTTEMINSAIEYTIDSIFKNNFNKLAGMAKDISAGSVCVASFFVAIIGFSLFLPKTIAFVRGLFS
jgi:diacylglycerol kinase